MFNAMINTSIIRFHSSLVCHLFTFIVNRCMPMDFMSPTKARSHSNKEINKKTAENNETRHELYGANRCALPNAIVRNCRSDASVDNYFLSDLDMCQLNWTQTTKLSDKYRFEIESARQLCVSQTFHKHEWFYFFSYSGPANQMEIYWWL